jgi:hypothetical protein
MIRTAFGVPRARRRPSLHLEASTPPSSNASPSVAARKPSGGPSSAAPRSFGAATTRAGLSVERCARPRAGFDDTRASTRIDELCRRAIRDRSRVCLGARREPARVSSGLLARRVLARARKTAGSGLGRPVDSVLVGTGTRGLAGSAGWASIGPDCADATVGAVAGAGSGSGGTAFPPSEGGSTAPGLEAGRKSSGSRYPWSSLVFRTPRWR